MSTFIMCNETVSDGADVMSDGTLFHGLAPITCNACLLAEVRQSDGTVRWLEEADLDICGLMLPC